MSLFRKKQENVALVDIRSSSIGVGYAVVPETGTPTLAFSARTPLDPHATEPIREAFPRVLENVLHQLSSEGAPLLRSVSGSGTVDRVLVTVASPWQSSHVFSRVIENDKPFVFTRADLAKASKGPESIPEGMALVSELVIATLLNGYEVSHPFNKRVNHVELIMLSSAIDELTLDATEKSVRKALHQHKIEWNAFLPELFSILRDVYPHQRDYMVFDISNESSDVLLVKHGLLLQVATIPHGVAEMARAARGVGLSSPTLPVAGPDDGIIDSARNSDFASKIAGAENAWLAEIKTTLSSLAAEEPLPRTVFLFAESNVREFLTRLLDAPTLRTLWLSDEAISIIPILPAQLASFVQTEGAGDLDAALAVLALASQKRLS